MTADHMAEVVDLDVAKLTPAQKRDAARRLAATDLGLSGGDLGRRFGMDARWGRRQAEAGRREAPASDRPGHIGVTAPAPPAPGEAPPGTADVPPGTADVPPGDRPAPGEAPPGTPAPPPPDRPAPPDDRWYDRAGLVVGRLGGLAVAAALSYSHMRQLVLDAGDQPWQATLWPLSVDGLLIYALVSLNRARREGVGTLAPWVALVAALAASLAANVASAQPTALGRFVAAWPPLALLAIEVLGRPRGRQ